MKDGEPQAVTDDLQVPVNTLASLSPVQSPEDPTLHEMVVSQPTVDLGEISVNMADSFARFSEGVSLYLVHTKPCAFFSSAGNLMTLIYYLLSV